ncbi:hypothetical protein BHE97_17115 [Aeromicrobium sp. PE09-221]|nr:hypothetical protein BHE97_17115 [Aeromicrobium sp. PE09-221]
MPTFHDPVADATEAASALRGLAHASRSFEDPDQTYGVLADLLAASRSFRQVLDQLADAHLTHRGQARDEDGSRAPGLLAALSAADELHEAGTLLDQAKSHLVTALREAGRIAWHPYAPEAEVPVGQWVPVVILNGEDTDHVVELMDRDGADAAIEHVAQWDYGEETTEAALDNGQVYDEPPFGSMDRRATRGVYTLTYSIPFGQIGLYRQADALPDLKPLGVAAPTVTGAHTSQTPAPGGTATSGRPARRRAADTSWFSRGDDGIVTRTRGRSL